MREILERLTGMYATEFEAALLCLGLVVVGLLLIGFTLIALRDLVESRNE